MRQLADRAGAPGRERRGPRSAEQQLNELADWIAKAATAEIARRFVPAILDHLDGILGFPLAGRARDDVRPGLRASTFHGGQDWEAALGEDQGDPEAGR